jgi:hypothetical protein
MNATATFSITLTDDSTIEYTDRNYECAAWWKKMRALPGVYNLKVVGDRKYFTAELDAVVVEDYFGSLFGGVAISSYDCKKNAGQPIGDSTLISPK